MQKVLTNLRNSSVTFSSGVHPGDLDLESIEEKDSSIPRNKKLGIGQAAQIENTDNFL